MTPYARTRRPLASRAAGRNVAPPPIPPPRISGYTSTTEQPLYWCAYGATPEQGHPVERLLILHGGPGAQHDYLLPQMLRLADGPNGARRELLF